MIQYKLIDQRFTQAQLLEFFNDNVDAVTREVLRGMAEIIVENTPVDTGTYADNHEVTTAGRVGGPGTESSDGKPRGQSIGGFREKARNRLMAQIAALPKGMQDASIRNAAEHAPIVEYTEIGGVNKPRRLWQPYGVARRQTNEVIARARVKVMRGV